MNFQNQFAKLVVTVLVLLVAGDAYGNPRQESGPAFETITLESGDGLVMTADLYLIDSDSSRPMIVLCHQAGWSRGEYREIAPRLLRLGFNCLAIDQRSGGSVNDVENQTVLAAEKAGKETDFVAAEQDIIAAVRYVRDEGLASSKVVLWGSSYSSALALRIAGTSPGLIQGVLAFAPGEYFARFGKPDDWIANAAQGITVPAFVTSAKNEADNWAAIFDAIPAEDKVKFLPATKGNHGSRALWKKFDDSDDYWEAVTRFLEQFSADASGKEPAAAILPLSTIRGLPSKINFGSCGHQDKPLPVFNTIVQQKPDLFIFLGDNIYGDTKDMEVLQAKYDKLGSKAEFQNLRSNVPVLSVWDDHDYGWNDAGKEYEFKELSKQIFMDFWRVPDDSQRRNHAGIYGAHVFQAQGKAEGDAPRSLQIILLDTRSFRDPLKRNPKPLPEGSVLKNEYQPDADASKTLLGDAQWTWLRRQLLQPADLRIICSSIQFGHEYNGWESWTNLPNEQERMVDLIRDTKANGVVFISGDVHWGEISHREFENLYPLYDVTASGLTEEWYNVEPNQYRVGEAVRENHFGQLQIDWTTEDPELTMSIIDAKGVEKTNHRVKLSKLKSTNGRGDK